MRKNLSGVVRTVLLSLAIGGFGDVAHAGPPPVRPQAVKSYGDLQKLLRKHQPLYFNPGAAAAVSAQATGGLIAPTSQTSVAPAASANIPNDYSPTNVQVAGVDEGDIVKTDGEFIYQVNRNRVLVLHATPDTAPAVQQILSFQDAGFGPQEVYLDGNHLVVIGSSWRPIADRRMPYYRGSGTVKALVYDISDKTHISLERQVEFEGNYLSTRKVDDSVYLVARDYPVFYALANPNRAQSPDLVPKVRDSAVGRLFQPLSYRKIFSFPDFDEPDFLVVAGFNLSQPTQPATVRAYLGAGNEVYASPRNLYVAASKWDFGPIMLGGPVPLTPVAAGSVISSPATMRTPAAASVMPMPPIRIPWPSAGASNTTIFKFALNDGDISFSQRGQVAGRVLNQFSMDEQGDYFRVATTSGSWWASSRSNNLFVLDANMQTVGSLTGIAPGEQLKAARFIGDRCYLVTFQNVDPLFVIDLSQPGRPAVLGQLTISGFSDYLQPYDATHLIGFGQATAVDSNTNSWSAGMPVTQGMKLALFDVTDVRNPIEMYSTTLGDRGTYSDVFYNPKALLFDADKNLLAFPVSISQIDTNSTDSASVWAWGDTVFQGAYVYELTLTGGFVLKGTITHIPDGTAVWAAWDNQINRVLRIGSDLYTLSNNELKVNDLDTLAEKATLDLPAPPVSVLPMIMGNPPIIPGTPATSPPGMLMPTPSATR